VQHNALLHTPIYMVFQHSLTPIYMVFLHSLTERAQAHCGWCASLASSPQGFAAWSLTLTPVHS